MKKLNKRQRTFVQAFTNISAKTYGNGTKSAMEAGYTEKNSPKIAVRLLKLPHICEEIRRIEQEFVNKSEMSREEKRAIAWDNYIKASQASKEREKMFWWQEVCKLDGNYITKSEITQDSTIRVEEQKQEIHRMVREAMKRNEN